MKHGLTGEQLFDSSVRDWCPDGHDNEDDQTRRPRAVSKQVKTHFHLGGVGVVVVVD